MELKKCKIVIETIKIIRGRKIEAKVIKKKSSITKILKIAP